MIFYWNFSVFADTRVHTFQTTQTPNEYKSFQFIPCHLYYECGSDFMLWISRQGLYVFHLPAQPKHLRIFARALLVILSHSACRIIINQSIAGVSVIYPIFRGNPAGSNPNVDKWISVQVGSTVDCQFSGRHPSAELGKVNLVLAELWHNGNQISECVTLVMTIQMQIVAWFFLFG